MARFVGRRDVLEAYGRLVDADHDGSVLVLWGNPGQGKTALVRQLAERSPAGARVLDLEGLADWRSGSGSLPDLFLDAVCAEIAEFLAAANPWWRRRRRLAAYRRAARGARGGAAISTSINASRNSRIAGAVITVDASPDGVRARLAHRAELREALLGLARGAGGTRRVLLIDSSERLDLLDALADSGSWEKCGVGVRHWFVNELVTGLLGAAPGLRFVLAGRDRPRLPQGLASESVELGGLGGDETAELLAAHGLDDPGLAAMIHARCDGNPLWVLLVAELVAVAGTDELADLIRRNEHVPLTDWVLESFLERLPEGMREVVLAAAVPRVLDQETVRKLATTAGRLPRSWYPRLRAYSFLRTSGKSSTPRMYEMVRRSVLRYLAAEDPGRLRESHRIAAAHFRERDDLLEWAYHCFANGDGEPAGWWRSAVGSASGVGVLDRVEKLADLLLAPEHEQVAEERLPSLTAEAMTYAATAALARGRDADADASLDRAASLCEEAADRAGLARVSYLMAHLAYLRADYAGSGRLLETAGDMYREAGDDRGAAKVRLAVANVALCLAHARHQLAGYAVGRYDFRAASALLASAGDTFEAMTHWAALAAVLCSHGEILAARGDYERAEKSLRRAREIYTNLGQHQDSARAARALARYLRARGGLDEAEELLVAARGVFVACAAEPELFRTLLDLGHVALARGEYSRAEGLLRQARAGLEKCGDRVGSAEVAMDLGWLEIVRGSYRRAEDLLAGARVVFTDSGTRLLLAALAGVEGQLALSRGDPEAAMARIAEARERYAALGLRPGFARMLLELSRIALDRHDHARAVDFAKQARQMFAELRDSAGLAEVIEVLGDLSHDRCEFEDATIFYTETRGRYHQLGDHRREAAALCKAAGSSASIGRFDAARAKYRQAIDLFRGWGSTRRHGAWTA